MYKVKLVPYRKNLGEIMFRQTKGGKGVSSNGKYQFFIDEEVDSPDFWVIQGKGIRKPQTCHVAPENTLLLTTEPKSVLVYPKRYIKQFGKICTCQEQTKHRDVVFGPAILPWFVGFTEDKNDKCSYSLTYDDLMEAPAPKKNKLISVITSNKAFTQGHLDRIEFVEKLKARYGDEVDVFGRGFRDFDDKWDVLAPYKYHISIENSSQPYYWTEKISDCFLAETFPIYYGCTNLSDYFPKEAFQPIDILDFDAAIATIDRLLAKDAYAQSTHALHQCKQMVLNQYNMFDYIGSLLDTMNPALPKQEVTINPCRSADDWHNLYNHTINRSLFKWKQKIKGLFRGKSILLDS